MLALGIWSPAQDNSTPLSCACRPVLCTMVPRVIILCVTWPKPALRRCCHTELGLLNRRLPRRLSSVPPESFHISSKKCLPTRISRTRTLLRSIACLPVRGMYCCVHLSPLGVAAPTSHSMQRQPARQPRRPVQQLRWFLQRRVRTMRRQLFAHIPAHSLRIQATSPCLSRLVQAQTQHHLVSIVSCSGTVMWRIFGILWHISFRCYERCHSDSTGAHT